MFASHVEKENEANIVLSKANETMASYILYLVHADLCGPFPIAFLYDAC